MTTDEAATVSTGREATERPRALQARVHISRAQLAVLFAILLAIPFVRPVDPDFWWHLRTGDLIVNSGIPRHDPFSWTRSGDPWVAHEWLSEALIYLVQMTLGYWANVLVFAGAAIGAMTLMYALGRRRGAGTRVLVLLSLVSTVVLASYVTVRPQLWSWLLFAAFVVIVERRSAGERAPVWALPLLMAVWTNLHLGFVYGFLVLGAWFAGAAYERLRGRPVDLWEPALAAAACAVATFANPHGPAILLYPLRYLEDAGQLRFVAEWQRPDIRAPLLWPQFLTMVLLAFSAVAKGRPRPFLVALSLASIALGLQAIRNGPYPALLLPGVAGPALARRWRFASAHADASTSLRWGFAWAPAAAAFVLALSVGHRATDTFSFGDPSEDRYPVEALRYVKEEQPGARLFNDYTWGGYIIARGFPETRVFIDGRTDFYRGPLIDEYVRIAKAEAGWQEALDRRGVDVVLVQDGSSLARALRLEDGWDEVVIAGRGAVFVRR